MSDLTLLDHQALAISIHDPDTKHSKNIDAARVISEQAFDACLDHITGMTGDEYEDKDFKVKHVHDDDWLESHCKNVETLIGAQRTLVSAMYSKTQGEQVTS
jgi:hypothetical protein